MESLGLFLHELVFKVRCNKTMTTVKRLADDLKAVSQMFDMFDTPVHTLSCCFRRLFVDCVWLLCLKLVKSSVLLNSI